MSQMPEIPLMPVTISYPQQTVTITPRAQIAAMAMQALITARPDADFNLIAREAIFHADALIKELEK